MRLWTCRETNCEMTTLILRVGLYAADISEMLSFTYEITGFHNPKYNLLVTLFVLQFCCCGQIKRHTGSSLGTVFFNAIKVFTFDPVSFSGQLALKKMGISESFCEVIVRASLEKPPTPIVCLQNRMLTLLLRLNISRGLRTVCTYTVSFLSFVQEEK